MKALISQHGFDPFDSLREGYKGEAKSSASGFFRKNLDIEIDKEGSELSHKLIEDDLAKFIQTCCSSLYLMRVFDALEFSAVVKSLPYFLEKNRAIRLLLIDGLHYFEHKEAKGDGGSDKIPMLLTSENFFDENYYPEDYKYTSSPKAKSQKHSSKRFEQSLVNTSLKTISSLQTKYRLTVIHFTAKLYLRKIYQFQKDILQFGLSEKAEFRLVSRPEDNQVEVSGTVTSEDKVLRAKVQSMLCGSDLSPGEVFLLR